MTVDALIRRLFIVIGVLVLGGVALWFVSYRGVDTSRQLVQQTRVVQAQIQDIERSVLEAELELRGVLSAPAVRSTAPVVAALTATDAGIQRLVELTRTDPGQHDRIRALTDQLASHRAAVEAELAAPRTAPGDPGLDAREARIGAIRAALAEMIAEEGEVIEVRRDNALTRIRWMSTIGAIALGMLVLFAIAVAFVIRRQLAAQRVTAAAVQRSEGFLNAVIENIPNMVFVKEARELRFERFNRAGELLLGTSRDKMLGKNDYDFFPAEQAEFFQAKDRQTLADGVLVDIPEEPIETGAGRRWLHTKKVPILGDDGAPAYLLGISEDITAQKEATEALREAKDTAEAATTELEAFSYSVAHDLRAPLRAIDGFTLAVVEDHGDKLPPDAHHLLARVRAASQRMAGIIDALLALARLTRVELIPARVDLTAASRAILDDLARQDPSRSVEVVIEPGLSVYADPGLLRRAMENLLANAWKFTAKQPAARIEIGKQAGPEPAYFIRDNGAGFDMAHRDKLFAPFQRLHAAKEFEGTGIGLATVAKVIERHGGRIWGESEVGAGATFYLVLPEQDHDQPAA